MDKKDVIFSVITPNDNDYSQGYSIVGDEFLQFGIKRRKMEKKIK